MDRSRIGLAILFRHSPVRVISGFIGLFFGLAGVVRVADAQQATTQLVSVSSAGDQGDSTSNRPDISGDGRLVVFQSAASNLVPEDQNDASDVFVRDLVAGITRRISVSSAGVEGDLDSESPAISGDGRFVSFVSVATNLVAGDTNNTADVFVHDRLTGETNRVSVTSTGEEANAISWGARLSYDGRYVLFLSDASNLAPDDANGVMTDLFVHDRLTGETSRLPLGPEGVGPDDLIRGGSLSDSGRWVAFQSDAANLVEGDTNGVFDAFVLDRQTGQTRRVSVSSSGEQGTLGSGRVTISGDGRFAAFESAAANLVPNDTNEIADLFVCNLQTGQIDRITRGWNGDQANAVSFNPVLSGDGRFVSYYSTASNLVPDDTNEAGDVFRYDRLTGETIRVSLAFDGSEGSGSRGFPMLSDDGSRVLFQSSHTRLVSSDTNESMDVFLRKIPLNELFFAQFGDGGGLISSQILLLNLAAESAANATLTIRDAEGDPVTVDLNGQEVSGLLEETVDPAGVLSLQTDGLGDLSVGSVTIRSDWPLAGHIIFGGAAGLAGVGQSPPLTSTFLAPVETRANGGIRTGIAVMNLEPEAVTLSIELFDDRGVSLAETQVTLPEKGQMALYVDELDWTTEVDFSSFLGSLQVSPGGKVAATVIQTRPGQFATLPVVPLPAVLLE